MNEDWILSIRGEIAKDKAKSSLSFESGNPQMGYYYLGCAVGMKYSLAHLTDELLDIEEFNVPDTCIMNSYGDMK